MKVLHSVSVLQPFLGGSCSVNLINGKIFVGEELLAKFTHLLGREDIHLGDICSGEQFVTDAEALRSIKEAFPHALAVDMESAAIAQVCHIYGVPFISARIISDTPGACDDHHAQYEGFWESAPLKTVELVSQIIAALSI